LEGLDWNKQAQDRDKWHSLLYREREHLDDLGVDRRIILK
jgi:hypothetical protein